MNGIQTPPEAFGMVTSDIYRSAFISPISYPFIKSLNLKTILILSSESPTRLFTSFAEELGIRILSLGMQRPTNNWKPISEELVKEGIEFILDPKHQPALITCSTGIHETGVFVAILRKYQNWNLNSILMEYKSFAGTKSRYVNEQFIEAFDIDLLAVPNSVFDSVPI